MYEPEHARITVLSDRDSTGNHRFILYWMHTSIRSTWNQSLEYAVQTANQHNLPLKVVFIVTGDYPHAQQRHYQFLFEGLVETEQALAARGISMEVLYGNPPAVLYQLSGQAKAVIIDRGYLAIHRKWYKELAQDTRCPVMQVESNVVVPVRTAYPKEAYSAGILRPKIQQIWDDFLHPVPMQELKNTAPVKLETPDTQITTMDIHRLTDPAYSAEYFRPAKQAGVVTTFHGGENSALSRWHAFLETGLDSFHTDRNDPSRDGCSRLSPYLHFGMISPLQLALEAREHGHSEGVDVLWEELIIRRELACNFTEYNPNYDTIACIPDWARKTLSEHAGDPRKYTYAYSEFEQAITHDPYWNAAQNQMVKTGHMHGYMRMYWGKKVLEWSRSPGDAYETLIRLNDTYELDGRDPNGYAGVAWCFGKHDRGWQEREIFGKVRYMNANGLRRKFDIDAYAQQWNP